MDITRKSKSSAQVSPAKPFVEYSSSSLCREIVLPSAGVAYCQILEIIFPNCINLKRIKMSAKLEHECFHNMKLFQSGLTRLKLDKTVPIERLIKGRFQDNFEFLQWLKKCFDSKAPEVENRKKAANAVKPIPIKPRTIFDDLAACDRLAPPTSLSGDELQESIDELIAKSKEIMEVRDKSYNKLLQIEQLITEATRKNESIEFCNNIRNVLYKRGDLRAEAVRLASSNTSTDDS